MNRFCMIALVAALCGCSIPPNDRSRVSVELERRAGYGLTESQPGEFVIPPTVSFEDGLSEGEAVAVALWNNAAFQETLADLGISRADLIQAGMLPNPTLSVFIPIGPKPLEIAARFPLEVLWLRPKRVAAATLDYERTAQWLVQTGLDLIRDVRVAYSDFTLANDRVKVAEQSAALAAQIEGLADARLAAGEISDLEASTARVDTLQTVEQSVRARHDTEVTRERLGHLMGLTTERWSLAVNEAVIPMRVDQDAEPLVTAALLARPDFRAADLNLQAAGKRVGLARAELFAFAVGVSAKEVGNDFLTGPTADMTVPIFNQNQGGIALAKAAVEKAARQYIGVRDRIVLEVREAHTRALQAQESYSAWHDRILPPLEETVRRAEKAYAAGDASFLLVLDTSRKLTDGRGKEATAAADLRRATAELERNIGSRLPLTSGSQQTSSQ